MVSSRFTLSLFTSVPLLSGSINFFFHRLLKIWHKATHYLGWLIGHEGQGSIMSLLKKKNWAHEIYAGNSGQGHEENGYMSDFSMNLRKLSWNCIHKFNINHRFGTGKYTLFRNSVFNRKIIILSLFCFELGIIVTITFMSKIFLI